MKNLRTNSDFVKNKKALMVGLGLLGGGIATVNWLLKHGAKVTVTDLKTKEQLKDSLKKIKGKAQFALGGHSKGLFLENNLIVANPDVSFRNPFIQFARKHHKRIENEATIFYSQWKKKIIGITGTRGKTTVTNWTAHLLARSKKAVVTGNSYTDPFLSVLDSMNKYNVAVTELSSFLLEFFRSVARGPDVAIITNIYQDHLNRYRSLKDYALAKANIFRYQHVGQHLILNFDNEWTKFFLSKKPESHVWLFSVSQILPKKCNGIFYKNKNVYFQFSDNIEKIVDLRDFEKKWGIHNVENLLASLLGAHLVSHSWKEIVPQIKSLPNISFRQETVYKNSWLEIINDTTATSPEGMIAALKRFASPNLVLICGGTDKKLDFKKWGGSFFNYVKPGNVIFLDGSATKKMLGCLDARKNQAYIFETLKQCMQKAFEIAQKIRFQKIGKSKRIVILFSPGAKSFEKFKNEFDRGKQFNQLVRTERRVK